MRTDNPALQVEQPKIPEALQNSTLAQRKAARLAKASKQVRDGENKAVSAATTK